MAGLSLIYIMFLCTHSVIFNVICIQSTAASQIFFMQLGFLLYEAGYVHSLWVNSIIMKNIEDTFIGIITFLCFGYTLSTSQSIYGIISKPSQIFLIDVDESEYASVFIGATFASTCASLVTISIFVS